MGRHFALSLESVRALIDAAEAERAQCDRSLPLHQHPAAELRRGAEDGLGRSDVGTGARRRDGGRARALSHAEDFEPAGAGAGVSVDGQTAGSGADPEGVASRRWASRRDHQCVAVASVPVASPRSARHLPVVAFSPAPPALPSRRSPMTAPIRVHRMSSPLGEWELALGEPSPALRPFVQGSYAGSIERNTGLLTRLEIPHPGIVCIFNLGDPLSRDRSAQPRRQANGSAASSPGCTTRSSTSTRRDTRSACSATSPRSARCACSGCRSVRSPIDRSRWHYVLGADLEEFVDRLHDAPDAGRRASPCWSRSGCDDSRATRRPPRSSPARGARSPRRMATWLWVMWPTGSVAAGGTSPRASARKPDSPPRRWGASCASIASSIAWWRVAGIASPRSRTRAATTITPISTAISGSSRGRTPSAYLADATSDLRRGARRRLSAGGASAGLARPARAPIVPIRTRRRAGRVASCGESPFSPRGYFPMSADSPVSRTTLSASAAPFRPASCRSSSIAMLRR